MFRYKIPGAFQKKTKYDFFLNKNGKDSSRD